MSLDPEGIHSFTAGGQSYHLFFGMRSMKEIEHHYDKPFMRAIQAVMPNLSAADLADKEKVAEASANIRLGNVAKLIEFGLAKHHPEMGEDDVDDLIDTIGLSKASALLGDALAASLGEGDDEAPANPPRKASRSSRTGSRS